MRKSKNSMKTALHLQRISLKTPPHDLITSQITFPTQWPYHDQQHRYGIWRQHLLQLGTIVKNWRKAASFIHWRSTDNVKAANKH